jgi:N-acylneuraminate cytidylyltransferase
MANWAFIPIRSGSKSIPGKNTKDFCGKPLVHWLIDALHHAQYIDYIVIALDSKEQESIVKQYHSDKLKIYHRSPENAQDHSSTESVMIEFLEHEKLADHDTFTLVQATSPFTRTEDFDAAISAYNTSDADSMLTAVKVKRFYWNTNATPINYDYRNRPRRQDFDGLMMENGAFYINKVGNILQHKNRLSGKINIFEMPEYTGIEIDEPTDWELAETLFKKHQPERLRKKTDIKLFLSDVDGVLTDAGMYYSENGDEIKKFCTYDGMGFKLLQQKGIKVGIITGENRNLNTNRANKLGLDYIFQGIENKLKQVQLLCEELNITLNNVAYIGDDLNDIELLKQAGLAACPQNAISDVKNIPGIIQLSKFGGEGVVRDFANIIAI